MLLKQSALFSIAVLLLSGGNSFAQSPQAQMTPQQKRELARRKFKTTQIDQPINIPNVPQYPASKDGIKFLRGLKYSSLGQGDNCVNQSFLLRDHPDTVREWYKQVLASNKWSVQPANAIGTQIMARRVREGSSVHVIVAPLPQASSSSDRQKYQTQVTIRYIQWQPITDD